MGGKITIDSATLMNKGLEVIEANTCSACPTTHRRVVHPQSIIHSLIQLNDGASLAHLGYPDMRVPISYALHFPERADVPVEPLDLAELALTFEEPDDETFACLRLAREAGARAAPRPASSTPSTRSRSQAFLDDELPFPGHSRRDRARARGDPPARPVGHFSDLYRGRRSRRASRHAELIHGVTA